MQTRHKASEFSEQSAKKTTGHNPKGRKKAVKIVISIFSVFCILLGSLFCGGYYLLDRINYTGLHEFEEVSSIYTESEELPSLPSHVEQVTSLVNSVPVGDVMSDPDVQNILVIGSDPRPGEKYGRSDTNLIFSINRKNRTIKMTSLLRDTYLPIPRHSSNRINAAHSWGGPKLLAETIETNYHIKIDRYVRTDFSSFSKIIDLLGGVDVNLTRAEVGYFKKYLGQTVPIGPNHFNGENALNYGRIRKIDSDFGRTQRQRNIIQSLINKFKGSSPAAMVNILNQAFPLFQTDIPKDELLSLAKDSVEIMNYSISELALPKEGTYRSVRIHSPGGAMDVLVPDWNKTIRLVQNFIYGA